MCVCVCVYIYIYIYIYIYKDRVVLQVETCRHFTERIIIFIINAVTSIVFNIILLLKPAVDISQIRSLVQQLIVANQHRTVSPRLNATIQFTISTNGKNRLKTIPCSKIQELQKSGNWPKPSGRVYCGQTAATLHTVSLGCYSEVTGHTMMPR